MKKIIGTLLVVLLFGCSTSTMTYQADFEKEAKESRTASPKWELLVAGSDLKTNVNYEYYPSEMQLSNKMLLRGENWTGFLKDYVTSFPKEKRDYILRGISRYYMEYDKVEKHIKFEPLRYISGPYSSTSYVSLKGSLTKDNANAFLKIKYYGESWLFAKKITVVADDFKWESPALKFYRDNHTQVWEYTYLDLDNPEVRKVANKIVSSEEVIIRFHGKQYYDDLEVTERMKKDIKAMLRAIDAIN